MRVAASPTPTQNQQQPIPQPVPRPPHPSQRTDAVPNPPVVVPAPSCVRPGFQPASSGQGDPYYRSW